MKISYNWLKDYLDFTYSPKRLCEILTDLGLEVGGMEVVGDTPEGLEGVVVGEILNVAAHPNADRLRICTVDINVDEPLSIVCGAPNVAVGQKVPVATIGTTLHPLEGDPFKIKKSKIRGEVSMGMICAEDELGIGKDHSGIMVLASHLTPGASFKDTLALEKDYIIEIDLTPNRIDGGSHYGVARDLGAFMRKKPHLPPITIEENQLTRPNPILIEIQDTEKCKRFTALHVAGIKVKDSPEWLQNRLRLLGLKPINNVVDITNYVMMELGQPLHAYDAQKLSGQQILVKTMEEATTFVTLNGDSQDILPDKDLMICDAEHMLGIGGVMGGLDSGVTPETREILIEGAYFDPSAVRFTAKRLGLNTDAAYRFERGTDPHMTRTAVLRAASLVLELAGGTPSVLTDIQTREFPHFPVTFSLRRARTLFGKRISKAKQIEIMLALDIRVKEDPDNQDILYLEVPPYRVDVQRPQDVMEEILRVYGYNQIETPAKVNLSLDYRQYQDVFHLKHRYADHLSANGFYEIMNNSLTHEEFGDERVVPILNPLSEELGIMRQSMLPSMLQTIQYNQNRQQEDLKLYEFGRTYRREEDTYRENEWLAMAVTGKQHAPHWKQQPESVSLFTLTRECERLAAWFKLDGRWVEHHHPDYDYGLAYEVADRQLLHYGRVNGAWLAKYDLRNEVFFLCMDWNYLMDVYNLSEVVFQEISLYPSIRRDVSILVKSNVTFSHVRSVIREAHHTWIQHIDLHDIYMGEGIPEGYKSYLVSITLEDITQTLSDAAADKVMTRVYNLLQNKVGAEIRK